MRLSSEFRVIAAFLAGAIALAVAAWFVVASGEGYVDSVTRLDALRQAPNAADELSSTTTPGVGGATRSVGGATVAHAVRIREARDAEYRHLDATRQAAGIFAALAVVLGVLAGVHAVHSERRRTKIAAQFAMQANHDPSTGLPNRRFFAEWLSYAIAHARRERGHVGVLFIAISGTTTVSELHGREATDALLIEIARRFRAASREGDLFARLGATEFALATPNARDGRQLAMLAQRLRDQLNEASQPPLADTPIGASIGIAFFPEDANDSAGIMAAANAAMYAARRAGRNHLAFNALAA
jgi:diguanylate cyclase (GGDEF)-like protein